MATKLPDDALSSNNDFDERTPTYVSGAYRIPVGNEVTPSARNEAAFRRAEFVGNLEEEVPESEVRLFGVDTIHELTESEATVKVYRLLQDNPDLFREGNLYQLTVEAQKPRMKDLNDIYLSEREADKLKEELNELTLKVLSSEDGYRLLTQNSMRQTALVDLSEVDFSGQSASERDSIIFERLKEQLEDLKVRANKLILKFMTEARADKEDKIRQAIQTGNEDLEVATRIHLRRLNAYIEELESGEGYIPTLSYASVRVTAEDPRSIEAFREVVLSSFMASVATESAKARLLAETPEGQPNLRTGISVFTSFKYMLFDIAEGLGTIKKHYIQDLTDEKSGSEVASEYDANNKWGVFFETNEATGEIMDEHEDIQIRREVLDWFRKPDDFMKSEKRRELEAKDPDFMKKYTLIERVLKEAISLISYLPPFTMADIEDFHRKIIDIFEQEERLRSDDVKDEYSLVKEVDLRMHPSIKASTLHHQEVVKSYYGFIHALRQGTSRSIALVYGDKRGMWGDNHYMFWKAACELINVYSDRITSRLEEFYTNEEQLRSEPSNAGNNLNKAMLASFGGRIQETEGPQEEARRFTKQLFGGDNRKLCLYLTDNVEIPPGEIAEIVIGAADSVTEGFIEDLIEILDPGHIIYIQGDEVVMTLENPDSIEKVISKLSQEYGIRAVGITMRRENLTPITFSLVEQDVDTAMKEQKQREGNGDMIPVTVMHY
jgi:hypothetical protein